ncbi:putative zinc ribbon protein [Providencia rettgeri]|uniref:putative zinc ribbon protein n=1 Tax=Providencia rettgeri TaxID=587 RepID=UPI002270A368|nr:putative zinc ribbon protein [Providencia rettgeri]MCX9117026.1 zinc-ribbon domain-containing protein [Providencia rettgeri]
MLKLHEIKMSLALTQNNRFAGATQEPSYSRENYYCSHCGEPVTLHKTPTESWFTHSEPQTAEHCPLVTSKLKHLQDKHRLNTHVRSVSPILKVTDWFCVQCRDYFTHNQKCCPKCHEGIWCIPAENVTDKH